MDPRFNDSCPYKRGKDKGREGPCGDRGRDWSDASSDQGMPRTAHNHQRLGEGYGMDSPPEAPERINPVNIKFQLPEM